MTTPRFILAAVLAASCASAGRTDTTAAGESPADATPRLERFAPAGAEAIVTVDYARLRARGFARLFADADDETRARLREARGFSDADDVDRSVTVTFPGARGPSALELFEGRFSAAATDAAFARRHGGAARARWRDRPLVSAPDGGSALSQPEEGVLLMGPPTELRGGLDCRARVAPCLDDEPWDRELRAALAMRWPARAPTVLEVRARVGDDMRERLMRELGDGDRLLWFGLRVGVERGLEALLVARARDDREARDFAARLRGHLGELAKRPLITALGLAPSLSHVRIATDGDQIQARIALDEAEWTRVERRLEEVATAVRQARDADAQREDAATR